MDAKQLYTLASKIFVGTNWEIKLSENGYKIDLPNYRDNFLPYNADSYEEIEHYLREVKEYYKRGGRDTKQPSCTFEDEIDDYNLAVDSKLGMEF